MLTQKIELATKYLQSVLVMFAPKRTGNLSLNAIRMVQISPNYWQIIIGGEIAPYTIYTNENWTSPRWKGAINPNERWVERSIEYAMPMIKQIMGGRLEISDVMNRLSSETSGQFERLWRGSNGN